MIVTSANLPGSHSGRIVPVPTRSSSALKLALRVGLALGIASVSLTLAACEDKAIGRVCEAQADGGANEVVLNAQALECPTRVCLRPARDLAKSEAVDTTALCTAECSKDSDCDGAETRNSKNTLDKRCKTGFVCGVARVTGSNFCCRKLCMCKDFLVIPSTGLETPSACSGARGKDYCPLDP